MGRSATGKKILYYIILYYVILYYIITRTVLMFLTILNVDIQQQ